MYPLDMNRCKFNQVKTVTICGYISKRLEQVGWWAYFHLQAHAKMGLDQEGHFQELKIEIQETEDEWRLVHKPRRAKAER